MNFDLAILSLVLFFALWGAFTGAARQVGNMVAAVVAGISARPIGAALGPFAAAQLKNSLLLGTVAAGFVAFILIFVVVRFVVTRILRRVLTGKNPDNRGADRFFGFLLGGGRIAAITWVVVCALSFVEENVAVAGKKFGLSPKDSVVFQVAKTHNLFTVGALDGADELASVLKIQKDPKAAGKLKESSDYAALKKNPRFAEVQKTLNADAIKKALETGDVKALMNNQALIDLLKDPSAKEQLEKLSLLAGQ